jgi:hypothetical protein
MQRAAAMLAVVVSALALGCGGEPSVSGQDEPLRVAGAVFKAGALPGHTADNAPDSGAAAQRLAVTSVETASTVLRPAQTQKKFNGRATDDGYAIALSFVGLGSGYWVKPLDEPDTAYPGELSWRVALELAADLPLGNQKLAFVTIDSHGQGGVQQTLDVCVAPRFDTSLNACDPTQTPPAALISLTWDVPSDLDLVVQTPSGKLVNARSPSTLAKHDMAEDGTFGVLYTAQGTTCGDVVQEEDLIWRSADPEPGDYLVYANLFNACGKSTTHFALSAYARTSGELPDTYELTPVQSVVHGELLAGDANGGSSTGLFVTTIRF